MLTSKSTAGALGNAFVVVREMRGFLEDNLTVEGHAVLFGRLLEMLVSRGGLRCRCGGKGNTLRWTDTGGSRAFAEEGALQKSKSVFCAGLL